MSLKGLAAGESQDGHAEGVLCQGEVLIEVGLVSMTCRAVCISLALMAVPTKRSASPSKGKKREKKNTKYGTHRVFICNGISFRRRETNQRKLIRSVHDFCSSQGFSGLQVPKNGDWTDHSLTTYCIGRTRVPAFSGWA